MDTHAPSTGGPEPIPGGNWGTTVGAKAPGGDNLQSQVSSLFTLKNPSGKSSHCPAMLLGPPCAVMNTMGQAVGKHVLKNWWLPWLFHLCQSGKAVVQEEIVMALIYESVPWDHTVFQFKWKDKMQCCVFYEDQQNLRVV